MTDETADIIGKDAVKERHQIVNATGIEIETEAGTVRLNRERLFPIRVLLADTKQRTETVTADAKITADKRNLF